MNTIAKVAVGVLAVIGAVAVLAMAGMAGMHFSMTGGWTC